MQEVQTLHVFRVRVVFLGLAAEKDIDRREPQREPGHCRLVDSLEHHVDLEEVDAGIYER